MLLKHIYSVFCASLLTCGLMLASCGSDGTSISKRDVKNAVEDLPIMGDSVCFNTVGVGYYEVNRETYIVLNQLKNAGLVRASFKLKTHEVSQYGDDLEAEVVDEKHMFANVELTLEGQKYVISEKQLNLRSDYTDIYEEMNPENPDRDNPDFMEVSSDVMRYFDKAIKKEKKEMEKIPYDDDEENPVFKNHDYDYYSDGELDEYQIAKKKEKVKVMHVLAGRYELEEVYDINATEEMCKKGEASCKFILKKTDLTPFGYATKDSDNRRYLPFRAQLRHYIDKGWVVESIKLLEDPFDDISFN